MEADFKLTNIYRTKKPSGQNLTLLISEWSINGTRPDGKSINLTGRGTVILRRQSDGNRLMIIENPWGTD
jgi:ketosteroid isomerase-like protein